MLRVEGLSFQRGTRAVLRGLDLELAAGDVRLLVGASGAGKTTLLRLLAGLDTPDAGRILFGGTLGSSPGSILVPPHQRALAMTFQDGAFWPHMTVEGHLSFGLDRRESDRERRRRLVADLLNQFGLAQRRDAKPDELSGGERQRLGLARAFSQQPRLLLLDEPLAHVDLPAQAELVEVAFAAIRKAGMSAIWATHRPEEIASRSDSASILVGGRLEAFEPTR